MDAADRQAYMELQQPTHNQYVVAHSWQQDRTSFYQPDWYRPPPDPDPPYAPPAYANRADHSQDWQHLRPPDATPLHGTNHQFDMNSCWYPPPPLTSALPHQNYLQRPPPKTYNPSAPLPILDCGRVEDGSADSTERIHDSSSGFDEVEKVEKLEKSSQDSPRKEKPVQGREELECSRQSSHHDHPQPPSCSHHCSATAPLPPVAATPNSTSTCTTSASPPAVIPQSRSWPKHSVVDAVPPPPQAAITSTCSLDRIDALSPAPLPIGPPPQVVLSPPCSLDMINIAVQRRGKSSILDGEVESILTNQGTIRGIASRNQPMITGVDGLKDVIMGQVKIFLQDTCAFDPGGITCEACYWRSSLLLDFRFPP